MRQLIGAIYISFGFLFYLLNGFEGYFPRDNKDWIVGIFIFVGLTYLFIDLRSFIKKKFNN
ncbi:hypothetical protein [Bacillus sp. ISL-39]|uniref:hypothetical protein n=1 Tax=Bacillus sp. ISL-39 TaxID=2819124 RepID=UPI001BEAA87C|nr:hypothetical protein [Bacillus sp. ISL-39]MBT2639859.1 hypothetical protein [Bacillus sp. ISL-39]